jgi:hypothetical protein
MKQIRDVVWERQVEANRRDLALRETELRILAQFVAGAAGWESGVKEAMRLKLIDDEGNAPKPMSAAAVKRFAGSL